MKRIGCLWVLLASAAAAEMRPVPTGGEGWFGDPMTWAFRAEGVSCAHTNASGLAIYEAAPLSDAVVVEAVVTPQRATQLGWEIASVAIASDEHNFWHLALVQAPPALGGKHTVELAEMRGSEWLAQSNLKVEVNEESGEPWAFGQPYRMRISMDKAGVSGTITGPDGKALLNKRYAFSAAAVTCGRPALRVSGVAGAFAELRAESGAPVAEKRAEPAFPAYASDNAVPNVSEKATGFFRVVQKPDGRWWAIDPLGRGAVLLGVDHVTFTGHWCEKLGYSPHGRKNEKRFANHAEWEAETLARLKAWGFTMLGAGCDERLKRRGLVHTEFLGIGDYLATLGDEYDIAPNERRPCSAFPNVFHPDFEAFCRYRAKLSCVPSRNDPWLFGYFIDNELAWWGRGGSDTGLFDEVMKKGPAHTAKIALKEFVAARCDRKVENFNAAFGTQLKAFDEILALQALQQPTPEARALKKAFLVYAADRYFSVTTKAIREADPNHLVLGARFAGTAGADSVVWEVSGKYCDVVTFNCYPMADLDEGRVYTQFGKNGEPVTEHFARFYGYVKRPMLITEWSFPALDAGLPSIHGAGQRFRTQAERTAATSLFARTMLSLPFLLGYDYFMWVDEPALGISTPFPEDSNYGLINEDGAPYAQLTEMFAALHRGVGVYRFKPTPEFKPRPNPGPVPSALAVAKRGAAPGGAPATFARDGDAFRAGNGRLELGGALGAGHFVRRVALDGAEKPFGQYNAMLETFDPAGRFRWTDSLAVKSVEGRVEDGVAVVEITGGAAAGQEGFEVTHRLLLPPGAPWFVSEVVSVKNVGTLPLRLKGLYFRLYSDFNKPPDEVPPNLWGMPMASCWRDPADGRYFGAVASSRSDLQIRFWIGETGTDAHPDAWQSLPDDTAVAPGAVYTPAEPVYVICFAGRGDAGEWLKEAGKLKAVLEGPGK